GVTPADIEPQVAREKAPEPAPEPKQVPEEAASSSIDQLDKKLETLKEWKDEGLITDEEYTKEKTRIIEKLHGL
ncbi:MAG: SHOCT domain-containing protein, partial [Deltaproteobacteria bacterium]|nr:SHOCT domain-containing protein [Deltaproteobacteria bacterium]